MHPGENQIRQRSDDSSVTIPYERSFRRIGSEDQPRNAENRAQFQFCGCGWPNHMLLPKGTAAGAKFDIFVMISDKQQDVVEDPSAWCAICFPLILAYFFKFLLFYIGMHLVVMRTLFVD